MSHSIFGLAVKLLFLASFLSQALPSTLVSRFQDEEIRTMALCLPYVATQLLSLTPSVPHARMMMDFGKKSNPGAHAYTQLKELFLSLLHYKHLPTYSPHARMCEPQHM